MDRKKRRYARRHGQAKAPVPKPPVADQVLPFMPFFERMWHSACREGKWTLCTAIVAIPVCYVLSSYGGQTTTADVNVNLAAQAGLLLPGSGKEVKARAAPPER